MLEPGQITGSPTMVSAFADQSSDTVTVSYPEAVDCNGIGHAQFAYLEQGNPIPQGAQGILCDGTNRIVLNFDDGIIHSTDVDVRVRYQQSSVAADRIKDLAGQDVIAPETQNASVQA